MLSYRMIITKTVKLAKFYQIDTSTCKASKVIRKKNTFAK